MNKNAIQFSSFFVLNSGRIVVSTKFGAGKKYALLSPIGKNKALKNN